MQVWKIRKQMPILSVKMPNYRLNLPDYSDRAIFEWLVNHLIHRDYTVMGGEVHIDIYDDRSHGL